MKYKRVDARTSAEIKVLYQIYHIRGKDLTNRFPQLSRRNIYIHAKKPLGSQYSDKRKQNKGRPRKISEHLDRRIIREVDLLMKSGEGFTSKDLASNDGILLVVHILYVQDCKYSHWTTLSIEPI